VYERDLKDSYTPLRIMLDSHLLDLIAAVHLGGPTNNASPALMWSAQIQLLDPAFIHDSPSNETKKKKGKKDLKI